METCAQAVAAAFRWGAGGRAIRWEVELAKYNQRHACLAKDEPIRRDAFDGGRLERGPNLCPQGYPQVLWAVAQNWMTEKRLGRYKKNSSEVSLTSLCFLA
jgi:hypothetical protein